MLPPYVVIPAKNEAATIVSVLEELRSTQDCTIVVVNDCSDDNTAALARSSGAVVLDLAFSLGAWGATQAGIRYAAKLGAEVVITMDADGQHEVDYIPSLLRPLVDKRADIVIGAYPERASKARHIAWAIFRRLAGFDLIDLTSGFRAYNYKAIQILASPEATLLDYQDVGVLIMLRKAGLKIVEIPVQMRPRTSGASRVFGSWLTVAGYMFQTALLCLAHWKLGRKSS